MSLWTIMVIPAILALLFSLFVLYFVQIDVSQREDGSSYYDTIGSDTRKLEILTDEEKGKLMEQMNNQ